MNPGTTFFPLKEYFVCWENPTSSWPFRKQISGLFSLEASTELHIILKISWVKRRG